ncbi:MAG: hypothetical protein KJP04_04195, partial [Arenicella sp.]|nr:hypothetical protein [Arenicella sp.]
MSKAGASNSKAVQDEILVDDLLAFIAASPTPFHATQNVVNMLVDGGFKLIDESEQWDCNSGGRYVVTRNGSSVIALSMGDDIKRGIRMIGAHTDSPCLRIKPNPETDKHGYYQLGVEVYGGALLHPWLDRDLSIAGRVSGINRDGDLFHQLINFEQPVAVIPNLAIHLDREANKNKTINPQTHLPMLLSQGEQANFKQLLLKYCDNNADRVLDYELSAYDTQAPARVGLNKEFICSAR